MHRLQALLFVAAALLLAGVALGFPSGHSGTEFAALKQVVPVAKHPAFPLWAHAGENVAVAPTEPRTPDQAATTSQAPAKKFSTDHTGTASLSVTLASPGWSAQQLRFSVAALRNRTLSVPLPPPRFA